MDSENFNPLSAGLLAWVNKRIYSFGGPGLLEIEREMPDDEIDSGEMLEVEKKLHTLVVLLSQEISQLYSSASELILKAEDFVDNTWAEAMKNDKLDFESDKDLEDSESESELSEEDKKFLDAQQREMCLSPYDEEIEAKLIMEKELIWQRDHIYGLLIFLTGLRLGFAGEIKYNRGGRVSIISGTDKINIEAAPKGSIILYLDNKFLEEKELAKMPKNDRFSWLDVIMDFPVGTN